MDQTVSQETRTNLIVNHLPHNLSEAEFYKLFGNLGSIKNYRIMRDLNSGASFGFGFVEYYMPEDAAKAILQLNNHGIQNKKLKVSYAQPPGGEEKETNLYIQNIPKTYTVEKLEELFSQYGKITEKLIFKDLQSGEPKGIGFVRFEKKVEADAAIQGMNGQVIEEGTNPLIVKVAKEGGRKRNNVNVMNSTAFQAGYEAALRGRGRGQYNARSAGFSRGSFGNMGGLGQQRGFPPQADFAPTLGDFSQQGGKMGIDRSNNRYNPIGSGGGYGGAAGTLPTEYMTPRGRGEPAPQAFPRIIGSAPSYDSYTTNSFSGIGRIGGYSRY